MNQIPLWVQVFTALLTPTIAIGVAAIGWLQWRTAHQRVLLDLFERRMAVYDAAAEAIRPITVHGSVRAQNSDFELLKVMRQAEMLFGKDVNDYLRELRKAALRMGLAEAMMEDKTEGKERADWIRSKYDEFAKVTEFYEIFPRLCRPYLLMDQKAVRSPWRGLVESVGLGRGKEVRRPGSPKKAQ